jgi:hypothetical protein
MSYEEEDTCHLEFPECAATRHGGRSARLLQLGV